MRSGEAVPSDVWIHPSVEVRTSPIAGRGLFVTDAIGAGVVVMRLGGRVVTTAELHQLFEAAGDDQYVDTVAIGDDAHVVLPPGTPAHFGNHSCAPTMWPASALELVTRLDVRPGDELTVDYALITDDASFRMDCTCGAATCRATVTGEDWRRRDLQIAYAGHWPAGLQRRIDTGG